MKNPAQSFNFISSIFQLNNRMTNCPAEVKFNQQTLQHGKYPEYLGITLDWTRKFKKHLSKTLAKLKTKINTIQSLASTYWGANVNT